MSSNPLTPSGGFSPLGPIPPSNQVSLSPKKAVDQAIEKAAKQNLPLQTASSQAPAPSWWHISSWFRGGNPQKSEITSEKDSSSEREEEEEAEGLEDSSVGLGGQLPEIEDEEIIEEVDEEELDLEKDELASVGDDAASVVKRESLEKTIQKAEQVVQEGWWNRLRGKVGGGAAWGLGKLGGGASWALTKGIQSYAERRYGPQVKRNKDLEIARLKEVMLEELRDPQFVECYEMVKVLLNRVADTQLNVYEGQDSFIARNILPQRELIHDLLETNLARGFAHLAHQVYENRHQIPNYEHQPTLVNILSLLSQKASAHISVAHLSKIEQKYRVARATNEALTKKLFPAIASQPHTQELIKQYINTPSLRQAIQLQLFPDKAQATGQHEKDIEDFLSTLLVLKTRQEELEAII